LPEQTDFGNPSLPLHSATLVSERNLRLVIADDDPVFRLGLAVALRDQPDWDIVAEVERADLEASLATLQASAPADLLLLEPFLPADPGIQPFDLCRRLRQAHPDLPIVLLSGSDDRAAIARLQALGFAGYCPKGTPVSDLLDRLRRVLAGEAVWPADLRPEGDRPSPSAVERAPTWLLALRRTSLQQIDRQLAAVAAELAREALSNWDWLFWRGRQRELHAARWLVRYLLPVEVTVLPAPLEPLPSESAAPLAPAPSTALVSQTAALPELARTGLARLRDRLQQGSRNATGLPLEIDILAPERRQELLYLTLGEFDKVLAELQFLAVAPAELRERQLLIRRELWQAAILAFASKYYTPDATNALLVERLATQFPVIEATLLSRIPLLPELLAYLLHGEPLTIDGAAYRAEAPEAQARAELLLANSIIQLANAAMQFLLNEFAETESLPYRLYDPAYRSPREIARLRNELSWQARRVYYFEEPRAMFEGYYCVFDLRDGQVVRVTLTAPRWQELQELQGLRWLVTIAWEARDAIAPRVRALVAWLGSGVVYLLTQVIGKAIGLIGRGALQGLGQAVQESRYRKK